MQSNPAIAASSISFAVWYFVTIGLAILFGYLKGKKYSWQYTLTRLIINISAVLIAIPLTRVIARSIANSLFFSSLIWWIFGVFVISLFNVAAINFENSGGALSLTGGVVFVIYLISLLPKVNQYLPTLLTDGYSLVTGLKEINDYVPSLIITIVLTAIFVLGSIFIFIFNKKVVLFLHDFFLLNSYFILFI